jgi:hypothetical protein
VTGGEKPVLGKADASNIVSYISQESQKINFCRMQRLGGPKTRTRAGFDVTPIFGGQLNGFSFCVTWNERGNVTAHDG